MAEVKRVRQHRGRFLWITWHSRGLVIWFNIGGRKPLAHLPRWRRNLFHLPSIRWRLWPRPFRKLAYPDTQQATDE